MHAQKWSCCRFNLYLFVLVERFGRSLCQPRSAFTYFHGGWICGVWLCEVFSSGDVTDVELLLFPGTSQHYKRTTSTLSSIERGQEYISIYYMTAYSSGAASKWGDIRKPPKFKPYVCARTIVCAMVIIQSKSRTSSSMLLYNHHRRRQHHCTSQVWKLQNGALEYSTIFVTLWLVTSRTLQQWQLITSRIHDWLLSVMFSTKWQKVCDHFGSCLLSYC